MTPTPVQQSALEFATHSPGSGPTKWGLTDDLARKHKLSLLTVTRAEAEDVLLREYWRWDHLNPLVAVRLFDIAVQSGTRTAVVTLGLALQSLGFALPLDTHLSPQTLYTANSLDPDMLHAVIQQERIKWLRTRMSLNHSQSESLRELQTLTLRPIDR